MPKRVKRGGRRRNRGSAAGSENGGRVVPGGLDRVTKVSGKMIIGGLLSSGAANFALYPELSSRLTTQSDAFQLYRFTWLKVTFYPLGSLDVEGIAIGFVPYRLEGGTAPTTTAGIMDCPYSLYVAGRQTVESWMVIPRQELLGRNALKWFQTREPTSIDDNSVFQGSFFLAGDGATEAFDVVLEYNIEFCNPLPASVTLQRTMARLRLSDVPAVRDALERLDKPEKVMLGPAHVGNVPVRENDRTSKEEGPPESTSQRNTSTAAAPRLIGRPGGLRTPFGGA